MPTGGLIAGIGDFGVTELVTQAEQAKDSAESSAGIATTKAGEASTSATTATTQAGIATTKAGEASTSATNATTQASEAFTSATTATTQAGIATTKAGEANTSATNAQSSADSASASAQTVGNVVNRELQILPVKAGSAMNIGTPVYISSADGTNIIVSPASSATEATSSKVVGLLMQTLANNGQGSVVTGGKLVGLNTSTASLGNPVWLGVNGALIYGLTNKPVAPAHLVYLGVVSRVHATLGEIIVHIQNGFELDEIHDFKVTEPERGDVPVYNGSGLWENVKDNLINYPFDVSVTPNQLLKDAIINVELIGRNVNKQYTIGILRKNYNQSGILKTAIRIYEWVGGAFGSQSCVFQQDNYVPTSNIERIKLTEETTGIYFYVTLDWSKIPDGTAIDTLGFSVAGLSPLCIVGQNASVSNVMLDSTVEAKQYPFRPDSTLNSTFRNAIKNVRIFSDDMSKKYTFSGIKKASSGTEWELRIHEWANNSLVNSYRWVQSNYTPKYATETIVLTSFFFPNRVEVDINWDAIANGYNLTNQDFATCGLSTLCYRPSLLENNKMIVAGLGDSRIDQSDNNPTGSYNPTGTYTNKQNYGILTWGEILCDRKIETMGYNFGVGGETSTQILARIGVVLQVNPAVCLVWAGMNDISQNVAIGTITSNMQKIYEELLGRGIKVVAVLDNFATNFTNAQFLLNRQLNEWIRSYAENKDNFYLIDADAVVSNPTSETPTAKTQILYDTTHIGVRGAYQLGKQFAEILNRILPYKRTKSVGARDSYNATTNPKQLLANLGLTGTGGIVGSGTSGTVPTSWILSRSGSTSSIVGSVTTSSEGYPEYTLVVTANAAEDKFAFSQEVAVGLMTPNSLFKVEGEIEVISPSGVRAVGLFMETNLNNGTSTNSYTKGCGLDSGQLSAGSLNESFIGYFETPVFLSPTTISQVNWFTAGIRGQFNASGSATIKIRKLKLVKL